MTADRSFAETDNNTDALHASARAAFDSGDLLEARARFDTLLAAQPDAAGHHAMQGLICKYLCDWPSSLDHHLRSLALGDEADEALRLNAAIAAIAIGDWAEAQRQWAACGIDTADVGGGIDSMFGVASVRLNAWRQGETLFGQRIDPVRARLINVPLPDSGYRYGDIVLHDGVATGQRRFHQSMVPVFNAIQRLQTSEFQSFAVFATCPHREDLDVLVEARMPGIAFIEDWTDGSFPGCLRCSYGAPHRHRDEDARIDDDIWRAERNIGVAAQSRHSVAKLMACWTSKGNGRRLDAIESRDAAPHPPPTSGQHWWLSPAGSDA